MSSRLGQTTRFISNGSSNGNTTGSGSDAVESGVTPAVGNNSNGAGGNNVLPNAFNYRSHRGHKRGHSYGGPSSQSAFHHVQLESRPSHPSAQHGYSSHNFTLPHKLVGPTHGSSVLHKGHRRALSGCLPMVGMGAVAWSSLRELEAPQPHPSFAPFRGLSPEESRPPSPDTTVTDGRGSLKVSPVIPAGLGKDNLEDYMECGLGPCQLPKCFQSLANIKFFVSILALLVTLQQAVASGYVNSVITTIEARFEIPSRFMGIVASAYEMGNVITVLFVSYLGAKRHIPRWIAMGVLVMVVGCIVFSLPHFLAADPGNGKHSYVNDKSASSSSSSLVASQIHVSPLEDVRLKGGRNSVCKIASPQSSQYTSRSGNRSENDSSSSFDAGDLSTHKDVLVEKFPSGDGFANYLYFSAGCSIETVEEDGKKVTKTTEESYAQPFILFMIAQLLLGCGGSPLFTLGITYVDDHVPAESSSVYIGIVYAMAAFGPVLGFLTGAWLLSIPDYPGELNPDAQSVGMWWGGFLVAGILLFVACLPFFTFPRLMASSKTAELEEVSETKEISQYVIEESAVESSSVTQLSRTESSQDSGYGQSLKDIPRSIWRLITNPTYVVTCLGGCMELNIVSGFVVFLPKYLETQFSLGKSDASLYVGGIAIPGACLGIFAGGFVMKKMQLKPSGAAKFVVATNLLCLIGYGLFFFLGCENPNLAGATVPYPGTFEPVGPLEVNLTNECNIGCHCDSSLDAQFVCHKESQTTYFSACHAGCQGGNNTHCLCAENEDVVAGKCSSNRCHTLEAFMVILFFMTGTTAVTQMPLLMIVMRSVAVEERSFALGLQFVIFRLFGYIPSPIIFGNVIDSACILWSVKKCSTLLPAVRGRCLLYDVQDFRYKYVGVLSGLKLLALALFLYDYFQLRSIEKKEDEAASLAANVALQAESLKLKSNSVISLDKLFEEVETGSGANVTTSAATT